MKIDFDSYKEILNTLMRNKSRSFLTGFGVFWGVFMLVGLMGGGHGLREMLSKNFKQFATNSAAVFAQSTSKSYAGFKKGRVWSMNYDDVKRLKLQIPELDIVTPTLSFWNRNIVFKDKKRTCILKGFDIDYAKVEQPNLRYGRFLNEVDMLQQRKVCVLGKAVYRSLFQEGTDPCGQQVRVDSIYYKVVGVDWSDGNLSVNGNGAEAVSVPISIAKQAYNRGNDIELILMTGRKGVTMSDVTPRIRSVIARAHKIDPTDERAISVFNAEVLFGMMDSFFSGVNWLIALVGIGTLLAGAIGVSNIMLVTVRERTVEIGIRRAIGATPRTILTQIISESIVLTIVAGMSGIMFAVGILQMAQMATTDNGVPTAHYQISFLAAIGAVAMLCVLGIVAGLAPASRAMHIKPVDAMRDE